jgi:hypothetical protein
VEGRRGPISAEPWSRPLGGPSLGSGSWRDRRTPGYVRPPTHFGSIRPWHDHRHGFIIGSFTLDTGFLVFVTTALGGLGGVLYLALRPWLPKPSRPLIVGVLGALFGGAAIIHSRWD